MVITAAIVGAIVVASAAGAAAVAAPPDVTGGTLSDARSTLTALGIDVVTVPALLVASDDSAIVTGHDPVLLVHGVEAELRVRTRVPSAVGLTVAEATALMASVGLVACPTDHAGVVSAQPTAAGSVLPFGAVVGLTVTGHGGVQRPPVIPVVVPSVLGLSPQEGAAALAEIGLASELRLRGAGAGGPVLDQEPAAGTRVGPGSRITLVSQGASLAPGRSQVPDVRGLELDDAEALLEAAGLELGIEARPPGIAFDGLGPILEQEPGPGIEVEAGSTVTAVVDALVAVPDLVGLDLDAAAELLASLGLSLVVDGASTGSPEASGAMVGDEPLDLGSAVVRGSAVSVAFAVARAAPVPENAERENAEPENVERVSDQSPAAGTLVPAGSAIVLTLRLVDPPAETPGREVSAPPGPPPWSWIVMVLVLLLTVLVLYLLRGVRHVRWVAAHVTASPHPVPAAVLIRPQPGSPPSLGVRVIPVAAPLDDVQVRQVDPE